MKLDQKLVEVSIVFSVMIFAFSVSMKLFIIAFLGYVILLIAQMINSYLEEEQKKELEESFLDLIKVLNQKIEKEYFAKEDKQSAEKRPFVLKVKSKSEAKSIKILTEEKAKDFTHKKRGWRANWKVTDEQIAEIKKSLGTQKEIAEKYGISRSRVGQIRSK